MKILSTLFLLILTLSAFSQSNMPADKEFTSSRKFFKLKYPSDWNMYENPDGTYHFDKPLLGTGTFEIKESRNFSDSSEVMHYLDNESFSHPSAKYQFNENKTILHYNSIMVIEGKETMVVVWLVANKNTVLTCRYLIDNKQKNDAKAQMELLSVNNIIQTISFL
jgi:hypothetical protein